MQHPEAVDRFAVEVDDNLATIYAKHIGSQEKLIL
jgi:hypothetical protein